MTFPAFRPGAFDPEVFLRDYWQKKPLLIRNPWTGWSNPLEPDELAGLACEDEVESRLVTQEENSWGLEEGPLPEDRFGSLDKKPWTLLVQAVDHHVTEVADLMGPFRFIPDWRIDDVMVSYAVDGGGVGPHFDQYDVFLVQGLGQRRWQLGDLCDETTELLPHDDLRLLAHFEPREEWVLDPGDILYVPPRIAHNGVAVGDDCMTYSVGFRAPSRRELIVGWAENLIAECDDDDRYADPDLPTQDNPGEITGAAIDRLQALVAEKLGDREAFGRWFGEFNTAPSNAEIDWRPEVPYELEDVRGFLARDFELIRNPASRLAFIRQPQSSLSLFVEGECFECSGETAAFAELLCGKGSLTLSPQMIASQPVMELLVDLLNQGSVGFDTED